MAIDISQLRMQTWLRHAEWFESIDSTNSHALKIAGDLAKVTPFLIGADSQTAGRGRGVNSWWSSEGSLLFSVGVDMNACGLSVASWPRFSLLTGIAIAETLISFIPSAQVGLKWPNDVWINGRKVCGILIEQSDRANGVLIVGIGINVNNTFDSSANDQSQIAVSMKEAAGGFLFDRTDVLVRFLSNWQRLIKDLSEDRVNLVEHWSHRCVLTGRPVTIKSGESEVTGICSGIADDGSLVLRTEFATERCYAGTVRLLD